MRPYPRGGDQKFPSWIFPSSNSEYPGATPDHLFGSKYLSEIYFKADPAYQGRYSVPVLWDKKQGTIVNNESAELLRWLPTAFDSTDLPSPPAGLPPLDLYPSGFNSIIDTISPWVQADFNTGVYKAGFATDQAKYEENVIHVFGALNRLEDFVHANGGPYILGSRLTELDIRVYATVVRLDMVYVQHFKCNLGTVRHDYPVINAWLRHLYWTVPGFRDSTDSRHIKDDVSTERESTLSSLFVSYNSSFLPLSYPRCP